MEVPTISHRSSCSLPGRANAWSHSIAMHRLNAVLSCRLMQKLWDQLVSSERDAMLTLLTPKMDAVLVHLF